MTKSIKIIFLLVALAAFVSACDPPLTQNTKEPVTITFAYPETPDRTRYLALADAFHAEYPHITIKLRPSPIMQATRDPQAGVDAFVWWPDPSLAEEGVVRSLDEISELALQPGDFQQRCLEIFTWEDSLWALPAEIDMQLLFFSKALFDARNMPYPQAPWSWEDFLQVAKDMTDIQDGAGQYGLVTNPRWGDFLPFLYQHGGDIFQTGQVMQTAINWYADLVRVHAVVPDPKDILEGDIYAWFAQGKAAMWVGFLADRDGIGYHHLAVDWDFDWGALPLPSDQTEAALYRAQGYYLSAGSKHPQEAILWMRYLSGQITGKGLPCRQEVATSQAYQDAVGVETAAAALHAADHLIPRVVHQTEPAWLIEKYALTVESLVNDGNRSGFYRSPECLRILAVVVDQVMRGEKSTEDAIKEAASQCPEN